MTKDEISVATSYPTHGDIPIRMNSDLLFHYLMQDNDSLVLKGIISAFFDIPVENIVSATVENPISYGDDVTSKEMILDVKTLLNDNQFINLEMQVINNYNWPERSLSYLCRVFDNLKTGERYNDVRGAYHIGFLNYTLFPEEPQFFKQYALREEKSHHLFTSKFKISMVDLNLINQANDNDKIAHRDLWARFFKATKWEELHMLATQDKYIDEAALRVHRLVQDQIIRDKLWAREDYLRCQRDREAYYQGKIDVLEKSKLENEATIATQKAEIADKDTTIADMAAKIATLEAQLAGKNS